MKNPIFLLLSLLLIGGMGKAQTAFRHTTSTANTSAHITTLDHPQLNGNPNAIIFILPNWNTNGNGATGTDYAQNAGVYYNGSRWAIFNQNTSSAMPLSLTFNVLIAPAGNPNYFTISCTAASKAGVPANNMVIDHPMTNGKPNAIILLTQNWSGTYNNNSQTLNYWNGKWYIANNKYSSAQSAMPIGARFNVMVIENGLVSGFPQARAFVHTANATNTFASTATFVNNAALNGVTDAMIFATPNWGWSPANYAAGQSEGPYNDSPVLARYDHPSDNWNYRNGSWAVVNSDGTAMPNGAKFNVVALTGISQPPPNIAENWDFESGNINTWIKEGTAFNTQPTYGSIAFNRSGLYWGGNVSIGGDYWQGLTPQIEWNNGRQGNYWIGTSDNHPRPEIPYTNLQGDGPTGKLFSKEFTINSRYISFLLGGKSTNGLCKVELLCLDDGSIAKSTRVIVGWRDQVVGGKVVQLPITQTTNLATRVIEGKSYLVVQSMTTNQIAIGGTNAALDNSFFVRRYFQIPDSLYRKQSRLAIIDDNPNGHINVDDFRFENNLSASPVDNTKLPLWGFVDMHTHPASHLGFGRKIMHGLPDYPADQTNIAAALNNCNANHGGWGIDNTGGNYIRMTILKMMDKHNPYNNGELDHNHNGFPLYPNNASVAHQQMWHEWIERAYRGGLRVMVALAVNNYLLAEAVDGDAGYKRDKESADKQLEFMVEFVARHPFMQIARSAAEMRSIVSQGKLAVILGIEVDNWGDFNDPTKVVNEETVKAELQRLYFQKGVRYIFPVHFADTRFGGCALYSPSYLSNLASHFTRSFVSITATPPEVIAAIPGLKYVVERAPDPRITYRLTNQFELDRPGVTNAGLITLQTLVNILEGHPSPCAGAIADPVRGIPCAAAGIDLLCPNLQCALNREPEYRIVKNFMLTPSPEYETYALTSGGHRNNKGITGLGVYAIKEMMRLGMLIDIDHMSEKMADTVLLIASQNGNDYPINSGHTGFRGNGGNSENTRTDEQLEIIKKTGGSMGLGIAQSIAPMFLHGYRYGMPRLNGINFGSDINGMEVMPAPRFLANGALDPIHNYNVFGAEISSRANNKVRYTNTNEGPNRALTMCQTAGKTWNYNTDGMAHVGLYPDYLQDLKNLGMTDIERGRLFLGAEFFAQMWEKCERQKTNIR